MCWGAGILLSSGVVRAMVSVEGNLGWKLPFALQWIWPLPLLLGAYLAPESPWNSIRRDNVEEAKKSLTRLRQDTPDRELQVARTVAYIKYTTELEMAETANTSYLDCFKGVNLRRTEIVGGFLLSSLSILLTFCRTAWSGPHRSFAAMPSLVTRSSSSSKPAFPKSKPSTSTFPYPPATLLEASSAGSCFPITAAQRST